MTERIAVAAIPFQTTTKKTQKTNQAFANSFLWQCSTIVQNIYEYPLVFFTRSYTKMCVVREDTTPLIIPTYDPDWIMSHLSERERIKTRTTKL